MMIEKLIKQFADGEITVYQMWDKIDELLACHKFLRNIDEKEECCGMSHPCPLFTNQISAGKLSSSI